MTDLSGARSERSLTVNDYLRAEEMEEREVRGVVGTVMVEDGAGGGGGDREDLATTVQCMTPAQIVSRWVKKLRHRKVGSDKKKTAGADGGGMVQAECLTNCFREETEKSLDVVEDVETPGHESAGVSGQQEQITSFKLGAGLGLALVVAASKNELDKMMELQKQMEMIVEDAKGELRCKPAASTSSQTCENPAYSTTNINESINSNDRVSAPSCIGSRSSPYAEIGGKESPYVEIDDKEWSRGECDEERCVLNGMAQLESELEAELQLLELQLDSADTSRDNQDIVQESSDCGSETLGCDEEVNYANDPIDNFGEAHCDSVPPQELERRLHELLEAQQLERIKELEAALRRTKQKLRKKEVEVCWWKDTAHFISQHVSKTASHSTPPWRDETHKNFT